ncbi:MAG: SGNH/GDSL hydrolase family protein [Kiritimatiellia bacterium]
MNERLFALLFTTDGQIESALFQKSILGLQAILVLGGLGLALAGRFAGPDRTRRVAARIVALIMGVGVSLLLAEGLVRILMPTPFALSEVTRFLEYHERLGQVFIPGKTAIHTVRFESRNKVAINSHGMRNPEVPLKKPAGTKRIALLGDSFASNLPVPQAEVFTEVMDRLLPEDWEILNFGVDGYTTLQEWMQFGETVAAFEPDAVMVLFYLRNDLEDNVGYPGVVNYRPLARRSPDGPLEVYNVPCPIPPQLQDTEEKRPFLLITDFHLYNLIRKVLFVREHVLVNAYPELPLFHTQISEKNAYAWNVFESILAAFKKDCDQKNVPIILVNAPTILQVYEEEYWETVRKSRNLQAGYDLEFPSRKLTEICQELGIPFVDLLPELKRRADEGEILYFRIFQHWNALGNRRVGEMLADYVREHGIPTPK